MAFTRLKLTTFGQTIEAKRHQGKGIHFTRVAIGDGLLGNGSMINRTELVSERHSMLIDGILTTDDAKQSAVVATLDNSQFEEGFLYRELALMAQDPDTQEEGAYLYDNAGQECEYLDTQDGGVVIYERLKLLIRVEQTEQITFVAQRVQAAGASILRGGAFKPRTSPYSFQGLRAEGLELLQEARKVTGQPIVTELMNNEHIPLFLDAKVDMIQIGARNMQNFELLKAVGKLNVPVLLKRGLSSTLEELVMSAEYIMAEGNPNVVLCERGIRTFETSMRNTLDISCLLYTSPSPRDRG